MQANMKSNMDACEPMNFESKNHMISTAQSFPFFACSCAGKPGTASTLAKPTMDQNETQPVDVMTLDAALLPQTPMASPQHSAEAKREAYQHSKAPKDDPENTQPRGNGDDNKTLKPGTKDTKRKADPKPKEKKTTAEKATAEFTQSEGEAGVYMCIHECGNGLVAYRL